MKRTETLGRIWNLLYLETDLEEGFLKELSERILEVIEYEKEDNSKN